MADVTISNSAVGVAAVDHGHVTVEGDVIVNHSTQKSFTELAVPRASEVFQGRGDVIEMLDSLYFTGEQRKRKIVLCGLAGYGKTEMAKQYANHVETIRKINKTFWVVAETKENLDKHFESLNEAYETFKDKPCLYVFDNGESRTSLNQYLPPDSPNALVLITSQLHDWGDDVARIPLEPISTNTSLKIFKEILGERYERIVEKEIIEIIKFVEGIPLGLIVIAGDLRREMDALGEKFDVQSYKKDICSQSTLDKTINPAMASSYEKSLRTAIYSMMNRMMRCLSEKESNFTNKILCVCAHLNPDYIRMDEVKAILSELKVDDVTIARCAYILKKFSFIFHEESYYHIHRTCQDIIKKYYDANMIIKEECYSACVRWTLHEPRHWHGTRAAIFMNADENKTIVNKILRDNYSFLGIFLPKYFKSSYRKFSIIRKMLQHLAYFGCYECLSLFFTNKNLITKKQILKKHKLLLEAARASQGKPEDTVRLLLEAGSDVNAVDDYGWTALHCAAKGENTDTVRLLMEAGSNVHAKDGHGQTALHWAAKGENTDTVRVLMEAGSNVHAKDGHGQTALHCAARYGHIGTVKLLLEEGSDVHAADGNGRTALRWAATRGYTDIVELLSCGAACEN